MERCEKPRDPVARIDEIVEQISALYQEADKLIDQYIARLYRADEQLN
jgi:hypothetical protein